MSKRSKKFIKNLKYILAVIGLIIPVLILVPYPYSYNSFLIFIALNPIVAWLRWPLLGMSSVPELVSIPFIFITSAVIYYFIGKTIPRIYREKGQLAAFVCYIILHIFLAWALIDMVVNFSFP